MNAEDQERATDAQFAQSAIIHRTDWLDPDEDPREDEFRARWEAIGGVE